MAKAIKQIRHLLQQFSGLSIKSDVLKAFTMHSNYLKINKYTNHSASFSYRRRYDKTEGKCETNKCQFLGVGSIWFKEYRSKMILNFKKANTFPIS